jgi:hypothetical protein
MLNAFNMGPTGGTFLSIAGSTAFFGVAIGFALGAGVEINERYLFRSNN